MSCQYAAAIDFAVCSVDWLDTLPASLPGRYRCRLPRTPMIARSQAMITQADTAAMRRATLPEPRRLPSAPSRRERFRRMRRRRQPPPCRFAAVSPVSRRRDDVQAFAADIAAIRLRRTEPSDLFSFTLPPIRHLSCRVFSRMLLADSHRQPLRF